MVALQRGQDVLPLLHLILSFVLLWYVMVSLCSINIPRAKRELNQLNRCTSPQQKLLCLRKVALTIMQSPSRTGEKVRLTPLLLKCDHIFLNPWSIWNNPRHRDKLSSRYCPRIFILCMSCSVHPVEFTLESLYCKKEKTNVSLALVIKAFQICISIVKVWQW